MHSFKLTDISPKRPDHTLEIRRGFHVRAGSKFESGIPVDNILLQEFRVQSINA